MLSIMTIKISNY